MSFLVFIEFNKNTISESSSQAATIANELQNDVYGLTSNDDELKAMLSEDLSE